jgi:regulator of protease activity HflC (stomatin/prohibitin superfamily)
MLALKYLLITAGVLLLAAAIGITLYDLGFHVLRDRRLARGDQDVPDRQIIRWSQSLAWAIVACLPLLIGQSIVVVPVGMGGVDISQTRGTLPGTLYSGVHFVNPLTENVQLFDLRDRLFTTGAALNDGVSSAAKPAVSQRDAMDVQSREGLIIGLGVTVRYRLDPKKLGYIQSRLPQPVDVQIVPAIVASAWRELAPQYTVREIFSTRREEARERAAVTITQKLADDGIIVEQIMLRDVQLPGEYAQGLQNLLLKEQQDEQLNVETDMQQKQVRIAELQAEAEAIQKVKAAEGEAKAKVLEAKGESDAMQYTLPLKQKQIEQSKLEAEARKQATIENADAEAQAKVIDSKAELQRRNLLTDAEANRIRVTAAADQERMTGEAKLLNQSPLLINKIIAERLSDKLQMVMVPSDGKYFFANDVFRGFAGPTAAEDMNKNDDASGKPAMAPEAGLSR